MEDIVTPLDLGMVVEMGPARLHTEHVGIKYIV